jgi:hypothetical protein
MTVRVRDGMIQPTPPSFTPKRGIDPHFAGA